MSIADQTAPAPSAGKIEKTTTAPLAPVPSVTERLKRVMNLRTTPDGGVKERTYKSSQRTMEAEIIADIFAIVRRPVDVDDITTEIAEVLVRRWQAGGKHHKSILRRVAWFGETNAVAVELAIHPRLDFSDLKPLRSYDWSQTRAVAPMPEAVRGRGRRGGKGGMTLYELLEKHYRPERLTGRSANTLRLYVNTANVFAKYLGRQPVVADLNTKTVTEFLDCMLRETDAARDTVQKHRTQLVAFWNYCAKKGWLREFPQISSIVCPERIPDSWSDEELKALANACERQQGLIAGIPAGAYWLALLSVIHDTSERIGALMQTEVSSLDASGELTVRGEHRKGGKRDKRYRLRPITVERLRAIIQPGQKLLFPWPHCYEYLFSRFGKVLEAAGLPNNRRSKFHKIRRTTASAFEAAGGNSTELLDHQSRTTTKKSYLNPSVIKTLQPADVLPGLAEQLPAIATRSPADDANDTLAKIREMLNGK